MASEGFSVKVSVKNLPKIRRALNNIPDNSLEELKDTSFDLSKRIAQTIRAVARARGSQAAILSGTVTWGTNTGEDSILPEVQAGGGARIGRHRKPAYKLLFGSEFGVSPAFRSGWYGAVRYRKSAGRQYGPRNPRGYWFFPTIDKMSDQISREWSDAAERVIEKFDVDGG